jgi:hypothetical protein
MYLEEKPKVKKKRMNLKGSQVKQLFIENYAN